MKLPTEAKGSKNGFSKFLSNRRKAEMSVGPLPSGAGRLITSDKAEIFTAFFASVFTGKACPQASWVLQVCRSEVVPTVEEERVTDQLTLLDIYMSLELRSTELVVSL